MMIFTAAGVRSIADDRVRHVYRDDRPIGRFCQTTLVLDDGDEISGLAHVAALDALEKKLDRAGDAPPPRAA